MKVVQYPDHATGRIYMEYQARRNESKAIEHLQRHWKSKGNKTWLLYFDADPYTYDKTIDQTLTVLLDKVA